jgi:uncharacterized protein (TIGR03000 family)
MNRKLLLGVFIFLAVVGISLVGDQPQAMGGWWHRAANCGGWGGYYGHGGWGGCYGYTGCYGGWGGCYGYTGCAGWSGCYGGWGGCYGWSGCGGYVAYAGCGCSGYVLSTDVGCCGNGAVISEGKTVTPDAVQEDSAIQQEPTLADPQKKEAETAPVPPAPGASAYLNLSVPRDATVVINGHVTKSTGEARRYVSRGLRPNMEYQFTVQAEVARNGQKLERTKVVRVRANESTDIAFDFDAPQVASLNR